MGSKLRYVAFPAFVPHVHATIPKIVDHSGANAASSTESVLLDAGEVSEGVKAIGRVRIPQAIIGIDYRLSVH